MSLIEFLIAIFVIITVLTTATSAYLAGQKTWQQGIRLNEVTQNSRLALDKIAREWRQTNELVTNLPASEIEFQDGHNRETLRYLRYYLDNSLLHRQIIFYLLNETPVKWDTPGAQKTIQDDQIIAEQIESLSFSGGRLLQININDFSTKAASRNIK